MNLIEELEKWHLGHKSRAVSIDKDDSYGANCWSITLHGHGKKLLVVETSFIKNTPSGEIQPGIYQHEVVGEDFDDWPGLSKTLELALQKAQEYGL